MSKAPLYMKKFRKKHKRTRERMEKPNVSMWVQGYMSARGMNYAFTYYLEEPYNDCGKVIIKWRCYVTLCMN